MHDLPGTLGEDWTLHPYSSMEPETLRAQLVAKGVESRRLLPIVCDRICLLLQHCFPLHLLAFLAMNGLQASVNAQGMASHGLVRGITQPHVELLQALILTLPLDKWGCRPAEPSEIQQLIDDLKALADAFYNERYPTLTEATTVEDRAVLLLQERVRGHTQFVRNWGYHDAVLRIARELYSALDSEVKEAYGFSATDLIDIAKAALVDVEERSSARLMRLFAVLRCENLDDMVRAFYREGDFAEGDPEEFLQHLPDTVCREQVVRFLWSHADRQLTRLLVVHPERLALATERDPRTVLRVLDRLSYSPGGLSTETIPFFFMDNPVWSSPCINTGSEYLLPMPNLVFSHIHRIMRALLDGLAPAAKKKMARSRSEYLEAQVCALLRRALPAATLQAGVKWSIGADRYETDVLLVLDRTVLIVEAKSAALSPQGLRGAPDRIKRHVRELLVDPAAQSERLAQTIDAAREGDAVSQRILDPLGLDAKSIDQVIRLSVTLDDFSILSSCETELKDAGWVPSSLKLAPALNLTDLECVVEILEEPAYILHYLANRGPIQRSTGLLGDEMDYLGFYLQTAFGMSEVSRPETVFAITGMSAAIDHYYTSRDAGVELPKPLLRLPTTLRRMIQWAQCRGRPGWTTVCLALLDIAYHAGDRLDDHLLALAQALEANADDPEQPRGLAISSSPYSDSVVGFYVYPDARNNTRREDAWCFAQEALAESGKARCVVVGRVLERWDFPYEFTAIVRAD